MRCGRVHWPRFQELIRRYFTKRPMMSLLPVPQAFGNSFALEVQLYDALHESAKSERRIRISATEVKERTVRGGFLRWFFSEAVPSTKFPITRVEIDSASIVGELDLEGLNIGFLLQFKNCDFKDKINLSDATIIGFDMVGGTATEILLDCLFAKGDLRLHAQKLSKFRLCGAKIRGNLDMRGCSLEGIRDTKGESSPPLFADGLIVRGSVLLSDGFNAKGEIRLNGCDIYRNLDCSGASLSNPGGYSLSAAGAHIKGSAYFSETQEWITYSAHLPFTSDGTLRLEGAAIDGDLDCTAGRFCATAFLPDKIDLVTSPSNDDLDAIKADGLKVGADLRFASSKNGDDRFTVHGVISLMLAYVGGDFFCDKAVFNFPGEESLVADGISVIGSTFLDEINANGTLRFTQANLKQGLFISDSTFDVTKDCKLWTKNEKDTAVIDLEGPACGIYAPDADVGATFRWRQITKISNSTPKQTLFWLFLSGSKLNCVEDDLKSWQALDRFELTGCEYKSIDGLTDAEAGWRLGVL